MLPALHQCLWTQKAILEVAASTYSGYPYSVPSVCYSHYVQGNSDGPWRSLMMLGKGEVCLLQL